MVLLTGYDPERGDIKELLEHLKVCEECRKKVEDYQKIIDEYEDYIKFNSWGGS